jgi:hypothetical protein
MTFFELPPNCCLHNTHAPSPTGRLHIYATAAVHALPYIATFSAVSRHGRREEGRLSARGLTVH